MKIGRKWLRAHEKNRTKLEQPFVNCVENMRECACVCTASRNILTRIEAGVIVSVYCCFVSSRCCLRWCSNSLRVSFLTHVITWTSNSLYFFVCLLSVHAWRLNVKRNYACWMLHNSHDSHLCVRNFSPVFSWATHCTNKKPMVARKIECVYSGKGGRCWIKLIWIIIIGFYDILNIIIYFTIISVQTHLFSMWMWMKEKIFTLHRLQKHPKAFQKFSMTDDDIHSRMLLSTTVNAFFVSIFCLWFRIDNSAEEWTWSSMSPTISFRFDKCRIVGILQ